MSRLRLAAITALALLLALPASVLAATVDVTGTVTAPDGVSVAGVEIAVLVQGTDQIIATTTDDAGAWALQVDAEPGAVLEVNATGAQTQSEPGEDGCVTLSTPIGRLEVTIVELPLAAIEVPLDGVITDETCPETPTPEPVVTPEPKPEPTPPFTGGGTAAKTPPSTDALGSDGSRAVGSAFLVLAGVLAMAGGGSVAIARRRATRLSVARRFQAHPLDRRDGRRD